MSPAEQSPSEELIQRFAYKRFIEPANQGEEGLAERMEIVRSTEQMVGQVENQSRFMMYWLLQGLRMGPLREVGLQRLLPHCRAAMTAQNTPRVRLAAANLLWEAKELTEFEQLKTLTIANEILKGGLHNIADATLVHLVRWAICTYSSNREDILAVLKSSEHDNRSIHFDHSFAALDHLKADDICTVAEENLSHVEGDITNEQITAFALRAVRRIAATYEPLEDEEDELQRTEKMESIFEKLVMSVMKLQNAHLEKAKMQFSLAIFSFRMDQLEEALEHIDQAKAHFRGDLSAQFLRDIAIMRQQIVDAIEEDSE